MGEIVGSRAKGGRKTQSPTPRCPARRLPRLPRRLHRAAPGQARPLGGALRAPHPARRRGCLTNKRRRVGEGGGKSLIHLRKKVTFKDSFKCKFCSFSTNSSGNMKAHDARALQAHALPLQSCSFKTHSRELASACCGKHASVEPYKCIECYTQPS